MTDTLSVRLACADDAEQIIAFNQAMAYETEGRTLADAVISAGVNRLLTDPQYGFYLVAVAQNHPLAVRLSAR